MLSSVGAVGLAAAELAFSDVKRLIAIDGAESAHFAYAVSVSGDLAVVGAPDYSIGGLMEVGAAYVFERNSGGGHNWGEVGFLVASDGAALNDFGYSISVSGDLIVVGAPIADIGANADQGSAYVFERNQGGPNH
jgi:hypothetical protein